MALLNASESIGSKVGKIGAAAAVGLTGIVGAFNSADQIGAGELGIVTRFGKITGTAEPGLCFHWPWEDVTRINLQSHTINVPLEVYSKDSQLAPENVVSVTFSLPKEKAVDIYTRYGVEYFRQVLQTPTENIFRESFGQRTADQIIANREELNKEVSTRLLQEFQTRGVLFERLGISIKFNDAFNKSAEESAIARTKVNTAGQDLERKGIVAQQVVVEAKGEADAAFARKLKEAQGILEVGKAEAEVLNLKSAAFNRTPEVARLLIAEKWDGKLPTTMIPGQGATLFSLDTSGSEKK